MSVPLVQKEALRHEVERSPPPTPESPIHLWRGVGAGSEAGGLVCALPAQPRLSLWWPHPQQAGCCGTQSLRSWWEVSRRS